MASDEKNYPYLEINIDPTKIKTEVFKIFQIIRPKWKMDHVELEESALEMNRGLMNTMIKCYDSSDPTDAIMIRIHNPQVTKYVDRSVEVTCIKHLSTFGCAPRIVAGFKNGFCYEFIIGEVLSFNRLNEEPIWRSIAEELAKINSAKIVINNMNGESHLKKLMDLMWLGYPDELQDPEKNRKFKAEIPNKDELRKEFDLIYNHVIDLKSPLVLCHNDTRSENIIFNKNKGVVKFVDFESVDYNYQAAEIALHFSKYEGLPSPDHSLYPNEEFQKKWLNTYLRKFYEYSGRNAEEISATDVHRLYVQVNKFYLLLLISSGISGPTLESKTIFKIESVDFLSTAISNIREYEARKEELLKLQMPLD